MIHIMFIFLSLRLLIRVYVIVFIFSSNIVHFLTADLDRLSSVSNSMFPLQWWGDETGFGGDGCDGGSDVECDDNSLMRARFREENY